MRVCCQGRMVPKDQLNRLSMCARDCILNSSSERQMCHLKVSAQYKTLFMHLLHMLFICGGKYPEFARKQSHIIFPAVCLRGG